MIIEAALMDERFVKDLLREANEITAIMAASKKTERGREGNRNSQIEIRK